MILIKHKIQAPSMSIAIYRNVTTIQARHHLFVALKGRITNQIYAIIFNRY